MKGVRGDRTELMYIDHHSHIMQVNKIQLGIVRRIKSSTILDRHGTFIPPALFDAKQQAETGKCMVFDDGVSPVTVFQVPPEGSTSSAKLVKIRNGIAEVLHTIVSGDKTTETKFFITTTSLANFNMSSMKTLQQEKTQKIHNKLKAKKQSYLDAAGKSLPTPDDAVVKRNAQFTIEVLRMFDINVVLGSLRMLEDKFGMNGYFLRGMLQHGMLKRRIHEGRPAGERTEYSLGADPATLKLWQRAADNGHDLEFLDLIKTIMRTANDIRRGSVEEKKSEKTNTTPVIDSSEIDSQEIIQERMSKLNVPIDDLEVTKQRKNLIRERISEIISLQDKLAAELKLLLNEI